MSHRTQKTRSRTPQPLYREVLTSTTVSLDVAAGCPQRLNRAAVALAARWRAFSNAASLAIMQNDSSSTESGIVEGGTPVAAA
jgi:hypothetical protein